MSDHGVNDDLLNAFLDNELADQDIDDLLKALDCEQARARACRQSIAIHATSGGAGACVDISAAVRQAIAQEPVHQGRVVELSSVKLRKARTSHGALRWRVPAAGVALAASAALAAMIVIKPAGQTSPQQTQVAEQDNLQQSDTLAIAAAPVEDVLQRVSQQNAASTASSAYSSAPVQRVSAGSLAGSALASSSRELVIATPTEQRAVQAQWSLVGQVEQDALTQQRVQQQLNSMLINHARFGNGSGLPGALGYARVTVQPPQAGQ